jgi:hypothetical protein
MSHFTKVKTNINEAGALEAILIKLGYAWESNAMIRGFKGQTTEADYVIRMENAYDIGFVFQNGVYKIVADWWGTVMKENEFTQQINQAYAEHIIVDEMLQAGFTYEKQEMADGTVKLVMTRWEE